MASLPLIGGSFDQSLPLQFTNNTCQPPPSSIALSGVGTSDSILIDHLVLDFGTAGCGAQAATLPLMFTNEDTMAQPLQFTISGPQADLFEIDPAPTIAAGPASMATVNVTRIELQPPLVPGPVTAILSKALAAALSMPVTVALHHVRARYRPRSAVDRGPSAATWK